MRNTTHITKDGEVMVRQNFYLPLKLVETLRIALPKGDMSRTVTLAIQQYMTRKKLHAKAS